MIYFRQLMKSNYDVAVSGPKILFKSGVAKRFPNLKALHGNYGVLMHET